tara:strand:+ start:1754 stop:2428 length:675 start_codon:yes stop_codon:yes gene_type:complete
MATGNYISYIRVSTKRQDESGLGLDAQRAAIGRHLNGSDWTISAEFVEIESGRNNSRPQLKAALDACKKTKSVLLVAKIDRLSRNSTFINQLLDSGVEFVAVDNPHATRMMIQLLAVFADHEVRTISKRIKEALAQARERGVQLGNPDMKTFQAQGVDKIKCNADSFAALHIADIQRLRARRFTLQMVADWFNSNDILTARGGKWRPQTVKNIISRTSPHPQLS